MDAAELSNRVESVLASGVRIGVVCTGGGSLLVTWLLNHAGASRAMVEAQIPYHPAALAEYLEAPGPHRVEAGTAVQLASRAWRRACDLTAPAAAVAGDREGGAPTLGADVAGRSAAGAAPAAPVVGLGCTAALATRRPRRGADRAAIALRTAGSCEVCVVNWDRDAAPRQKQEELLSEVGLAALGQACGLAMPWPEWPPGVRFVRRELALADSPGLLCAGDVPCVERLADGCWVPDVARVGRLLLPGSFNPLHAGHTGLLAAAEQLTGRAGAFELSVENVDKPVLARAELERRALQFAGVGPLVCTRAPTFLAKAGLFRGCTFVVGYDTAVRLLQPRYYGGEEALALAFAQMAAAGTRFLVAGRRTDAGYRSLADLEVPLELRAMFGPIPPSLFRLDVSSTDLRAPRQTGQQAV
jgi:hypothetical protein